jgi:two-component system, cell cycle response regulator DivK
MARILVVEDEPNNLEIVTRLLVMFGHEVTSAKDGPSGVALARQERPDLILMDLGLPNHEDGLEATRQIRAEKGTEAIPIIAFTARTMTADVEKARQAGCNDFEGKPFDFRRLLEFQGHRVAEAGDGAEALRLLEAGAFDLVLLDRLSRVQVVNIQEPVDLYEVAPADAAGWQASTQQYEQALELFEARRLEEAARLLGALIHQYGADGPQQFLMTRTLECLADPEKWRPAFALPGK